MEPFIAPLQAALEHLQIATGHVMEAGMSNHDEIGAASVDYLRLFGLVALGFMWARMAKIALPKAEAVLLQSQDRHRKVLHATPAAANRIIAHRNPIRLGSDDGI